MGESRQEYTDEEVTVQSEAGAVLGRGKRKKGGEGMGVGVGRQDKKKKAEKEGKHACDERD